MFKNINPSERAIVDLVLAVVSLGTAYLLPDNTWPFVPTVLGFVGLVFFVSFILDVVKLIRKTSK